ncbi:MAG: hypothetical protein F6J89_21630 [Symploca sp. SIO1C4]|uniref:Uncharacterized protein n=1 Tax=Symploca sp. SIO1C4 TaxID=2607765 RepID=A0A6B3NEU6_9CYAN|nr:hypothetical protein [Symploca sp. SIO1C4]
MAFIQISPPEEEKKEETEDLVFETNKFQTNIIEETKGKKISIPIFGKQAGLSCGAFALAGIIRAMSLNPKDEDLGITYNPTDDLSTQRTGILTKKATMLSTRQEGQRIYALTGNITLNPTKDKAIYITDPKEKNVNSVSGLISFALAIPLLEASVYVIKGFEKWLFQEYKLFKELYIKEKDFLENKFNIKIQEKSAYTLPSVGALHLIWVKQKNDNSPLPGHWVAMGGDGQIVDSAVPIKKHWDLESITKNKWDINQSPPELVVPSNKNNNRALIFSNLWIEFRYKNQPLAKSLALELGSELILLNGEKVIFDKPVPTTPVTLEPKPTHRRAYTNGNGYRPY